MNRELDSVEQAQAVTVLCIAGTGQNGATLLTRMLGQVPGFVAVGELGYVWERGLLENLECGCGARFRQCDFWIGVGEEAFGGWDAVDVKEVVRLQQFLSLKDRRLPNWMFLAFALRPGLWPRYREATWRYSEFIRRLYRGISKTSGGRIIVDSMKRPYHVYAAAGIPGIDLSVVHLVRDSRGFAHSGTRWVERQGAIAGAYRPRRSPLKSGIRWMWINAAFELLPRAGIPMTRVRYESLVRRPRHELERIVSSVRGERTHRDFAFIDDYDVDLPPDHLVAGNRMRLHAGRLPLKMDDAWRSELGPGQQRIVSVLTWPFLRRYGYTGARHLSAGGWC
jgi:hypothetical protein